MISVGSVATAEGCDWITLLARRVPELDARSAGHHHIKKAEVREQLTGLLRFPLWPSVSLPPDPFRFNVVGPTAAQVSYSMIKTVN